MDHGKLVAEGSETSLLAQASQNMQLVMEVDAETGVKGALEGIKGVSDVAINSATRGYKVTINTTEDVRKEVSQAIVGSGAGLLSMNRSQGGLEGIFMEVVKNSEGSHV